MSLTRPQLLNRCLPNEPTWKPECQLLVSFQDASELNVADGRAVDIYDLKNPAAGPLGRPKLTTVAEFADRMVEVKLAAATNPSNTTGKIPRSSLALGELADWLHPNRQSGREPLDHCHGHPTQDSAFWSEWLPQIRKFDFAKFGTSHLADLPFADVQNFWGWLRREIGETTKLVPVAYADFQSVRGLSPEQGFDLVLSASSVPSGLAENVANTEAMACCFSQPWLLIDTYFKPSSAPSSSSESAQSLMLNCPNAPRKKCRLLDWLPGPELNDFAQKCLEHGLALAVAGSLRQCDLPVLADIPLSAVGVRGAISCNANRNQVLDPNRLRDFAAAVKHFPKH